MARQRTVKQSPSSAPLRLAIPSDGEMYEPTLGFLRACGMPVDRPSPRRYTAHVSTLEGVLVLFQRAADITAKVEEGSADMGIVGLDRFQESRWEGGNALPAVDSLGFSHCELVLAVPDTWVDVTTVADLADLAVEFRESGREMRVATKYPRLVQGFLFRHGINYFTLVPASGTLEAAPLMGYADVIADLTATGTTLRENRLKTLGNGTVLASQACLIGNRQTLVGNPARLEAARHILERIEAHLAAGEYYRITVNVRGESPEAVSSQIWERPQLAGLYGPTVAPVHSSDGTAWYAVTVVVHRRLLMEVVDHFRAVGGASITVSQVDYIFHQECRAYQRLLASLGKGP